MTKDETMDLEKLYFKNEDEGCQPLRFFLEEAKHEGLAEITLYEALPDDGLSDFIWCADYGLTDRSYCRKSECNRYTPNKSGRGVCTLRMKLYLFGEAVLIQVNQDLN